MTTPARGAPLRSAGGFAPHPSLSSYTTPGDTTERNAADQLRDAMPEAATFVFHDLRRTVRTGLVRLPGVSVDVAEAVIGHAAAGILKVYDRHDRLEEKRAALSAWSAHVESLVERFGRSNVVPLHRGAGA